MAQINHSKSNEMSAKKEYILTIEPFQKSSQFIHPSKRPITREAMFINLGIEKAFAT